MKSCLNISLGDIISMDCKSVFLFVDCGFVVKKYQLQKEPCHMLVRAAG